MVRLTKDAMSVVGKRRNDMDHHDHATGLSVVESTEAVAYRHDHNMAVPTMFPERLQDDTSGYYYCGCCC